MSELERLKFGGGRITVEAMSSCLVNAVQLTTNANRQLLIAFVIHRAL